MSKSAIVSPNLALPSGRFVQAINADGYVLFSRHVAQDPAAGKLLVDLLRGRSKSVARRSEAAP
jgi:hypothetical protein